MSNKFFLAATLVVAIFLSACSRNYVALDYTNAKEEVPQLSNLVFRFNKSLYPDSLLNNWDSADYISFEPKINGRFRWNSPDELVFSPSQPLLPATNYTASVKKEVLRFSKYNDIKNGDAISFHTAPLQLSDAQVTWVVQDESKHTAVPQISLQFNYPVKAEDLKEKMKINVDGEQTDYSLQNIGSSNEISIRLPSFKGEDKNYEAQISI